MKKREFRFNNIFSGCAPKLFPEIFIVLVVVLPLVACDQTAKAPAAGIPDEIQKLTQALKAGDLGTRLEAAENLGKMGDRAAAAVPNLIEMLADTEKFNFDGLVDGKMTSGSRSGGDAAGETLLRIGRPAVDPLIKALTTHANPLVRWSAAGELGKLNDPRSVEPLIKALADKDSSVRNAAAWSLGEMKDRRALAGLIGLLKDGNANVRYAAVVALTALRDPAAAEPLKSLLVRESDSNVRHAAEAAIKLIRE